MFTVHEKISDADTAVEMRAEIMRLACYDPMIRAAMQYADVTGVSAEDRYTVIAYQALRQAEAYREQALSIAHHSGAVTVKYPQGESDG